MRSCSIDEYQIGIICALSKELKAVKGILDEEHEPLKSKDGRDHNSYILGRVGKHSVVAAALPVGVYGSTSAAWVARDMSRTFPRLRFGLLVGIAGGIPNIRAGRDIRLGDVVVSQPAATHCGVVQYDSRKLLDNNQSVRTGTMDKPPRTLLTALATLRADLRGDGVAQCLDEVIKRYPSLEQEGYCFQGIDQDQLHCSTCDPSRWWWILWVLIVWLWPLWRCEECESGKVVRKPRARTTPIVHYGTIASGSTLLRNATERERLAQDIGALCVEMEAAGLDDYPCLVIRGICDYADSHKNDIWQEYAALTAAAFAKVLLEVISPETTEQERPVQETLDRLDIHFQKQDEHHSKVEEHNQRQELHYNNDRHRNCHRVFGTSDYERRKNVNINAVPGTCRWVLDNPQYREWIESPRGDLLWISADPGCGKSVLSKTLVDEWFLSREQTATTQNNANSYTVCYFFFKDNEEQSHLTVALCAIIHQLFSHQPELIRHALPAFDRNKEERLTSNAGELWHILRSSASDPRARPIICVLDALDECGDADRQLLVDLLCQFYQESVSMPEFEGCLKWLVTSRPHDDIEDHFRQLPPELPSVRLRGEDKNDQIRDEINLVINKRMIDMGLRLRLSDAKREEVTHQLCGMDNRTYLWLYLVLENIETAFKRSPRPNQVTLPSLPATVNQAYENILKRVTSAEDKQYAKAVLTIIVGARRPLTVAEMAIAFDFVTLPEIPGSLADLTIDADSIRDKIRSWCGLFVFIKHDQLYLIHQTAKEFLLNQKNEPLLSSGSWKHCLHSLSVEEEMTKMCIQFLCLSDFDTEKDDMSLRDRPGVETFFDFAADHWAAYSWMVERGLDDVMQSKLRMLYDSSTVRFKRLAKSSWRLLYRYSDAAKDVDNVHVASLNGHDRTLQHILSKSPQKIGRLTSNWKTPLFLAAAAGHRNTVKLLLAQPGIDVNLGQPLLGAVSRGHTDIIKLLLAQPNIDVNLGEPLAWAAREGYRDVVKLLLAQPGVNINHGQPLSWAAAWGYIEVAKLLLTQPGVNANLGEPLAQTASEGWIGIVKLLLAQPDVDVNLGQPLLRAASRGYIEVVKLLLTQPDINVNLGEPVAWAAREGSIEVLKLLLAHPGVEVNLGGPLVEATIRDHIEVVKLLLAQPDIDVNFKGPLGRPLLRAARGGHAEIVELLLAQPSVDVNLEKPLAAAARTGRRAVVELLLAQPQVDVNLGQALLRAAQGGHIDVVKLLLAHPGVDVNLGEPLYWALREGHRDVVKLLMARSDTVKTNLPAVLLESEMTG